MLAPDALVLTMPVSVSPLTSHPGASLLGAGSVEGFSPLACDCACVCLCLRICLCVCLCLDGWILCL